MHTYIEVLCVYVFCFYVYIYVCVLFVFVLFSVVNHTKTGINVVRPPPKIIKLVVPFVVIGCTFIFVG